MNIKKIGLLALVFGIGFLFLFPNFAIAASNEQAISGYHCEGGDPVYARHASIDSIGDDIVAVTTQKISFQGSVIYNVQLIRSTDNGETWEGHLCISKSTTDQWYPDVKMIDIPGEGNGKIVFVVWQETKNPINSPSTIYTKAVHFSNFNNAWYGTRILQQNQNLYNYPRVAGSLTDCASVDDGNTAYDLMRLHFVWEAYVGLGSPHWEIQMCNMYWENEGDDESTIWGGAFAIAVAEGLDLRHPSIDAGTPYNDDNIGSGNAEHVVLTYDCRYRSQGTSTETRFKYLPFIGQSTDPSNVTIGMGDIIFPPQNSYFYPDITIWGYEETEDPYNWRWETIVVGQKLDTPNNYIPAKHSINLGTTWAWELNIGSMGRTSPQLRGVAIDSGMLGTYIDGHLGGIYVIWDVDVDEGGMGVSEIRSRKLGIHTNGIMYTIYQTNVDTTGLYGGDLRYVATSITYVIVDDYIFVYTHNLYNIVVGSSTEPTWRGSVIYYRQP